MPNLPASLGYYFPAEWHPHRATWLTFPHNTHTWPEALLKKIYPIYFEFIHLISQGEVVCINVQSQSAQLWIQEALAKLGTDLGQIHCYQHPSNDAWCRDHGPAFLINPEAAIPKVMVDWEYNAWGGKYPPYDADNQIPALIAEQLDLPVYRPGIIMEGGSVDFNGKGTLLTTRSCLLNPNRNPHLTSEQIEQYLKDYYGVQQVLWLEDGIVGDDTDGHIDDICRFVREDTVLTVIEHQRSDANYSILQKNRKDLEAMRLPDGKPLEIIELPMPRPYYMQGERMPASYANFYIANAVVVVPTFGCPEDERALDILSACFPDRAVIGLDSREIIWGLGSFHCLSQQEPAVH